MNKIARIVSSIVLISFSFNLIAYGADISVRPAGNAVSNKLAAPSTFDDLTGPQRHDMGRIKASLQNGLRMLFDGPHQREPLTYDNFKDRVGDWELWERTIYQPAFMKFFFCETTSIMEDAVAVKVRIWNDLHGNESDERTYYAVFSLTPDEGGMFPINGIFTEKEYKGSGKFEKRLPLRSEKDREAVDRYVRHENGIDRIIEFAHKNGLATNRFNDNFNTRTIARFQVEKVGLDWDDVAAKLIQNGWAVRVNAAEVRLEVDLTTDIESAMRGTFGGDFQKMYHILRQPRYSNFISTLLRQLDVNVENPDALIPIEDRDFFVVKLTPEIKKMLEKEENLVTVVDIKGNEHKVVPYGHSSSHAMHIFLEEEFYDLFTKELSEPGMQPFLLYEELRAIKSPAVHEAGVMLNFPVLEVWRPTLSKPRVINLLDKRAEDFEIFGFPFDSTRQEIYFAGLRAQEARIEQGPITAQIVDLDANLLTRDYAAGVEGAGVLDAKRQNYDRLVGIVSEYFIENNVNLDDKGYEANSPKSILSGIDGRLNKYIDRAIVYLALKGELPFSPELLDDEGVVSVFKFPRLIHSGPDRPISASLDENLRREAIRITGEVERRKLSFTVSGIDAAPDSEFRRLRGIVREDAYALDKIGYNFLTSGVFRESVNDYIANRDTLKEIGEMASLADRAGKEITASNVKYTLIMPYEFFASKDEFEDHVRARGDRFNLKRIMVESDDHGEFIERVLKDAEGIEEQVVVLAPHDLSTDELRVLTTRKIKVIMTNINGIPAARGANESDRQSFQLNTYVMMLLARSIREDTASDSSIYQLLKFYLTSHFDLSGISAEDYIMAIKWGRALELLQGILRFRPIVKYRVPDCNMVAEALIRA